MKQTELMIGDWVQDRTDQSYLRIDSHWALYNAKEFEPIPITPDILKANGFEIDMYSRLNLQDGKWLEYYHHKHRLREWWKGIDEWDNHSECKEIVFQCDVFYVHELQHALRLCKIDKEIVL